MAPIRCPKCAAEILPAGAKFCPRCGAPSPPSPARQNDDDDSDGLGKSPADPVVNLASLPSPIPLAGILFIVALLVGPALIVAGIVTGSGLMLYSGIGVAAAVVILLLLGLVS